MHFGAPSPPGNLRPAVVQSGTGHPARCRPAADRRPAEPGGKGKRAPGPQDPRCAGAPAVRRQVVFPGAGPVAGGVPDAVRGAGAVEREDRCPGRCPAPLCRLSPAPGRGAAEDRQRLDLPAAVAAGGRRRGAVSAGVCGAALQPGVRGAGQQPAVAVAAIDVRRAVSAAPPDHPARRQRRPVPCPGTGATPAAGTALAGPPVAAPAGTAPAAGDVRTGAVLSLSGNPAAGRHPDPHRHGHGARAARQQRGGTPGPGLRTGARRRFAVGGAGGE